MLEPMAASLRFTDAMETPVPKITTTDEQISVKIYAPLPYGANWEEEDPIQKIFKKGDAFYNVVERRYVNDTLYFTLQRNLNAHDAFDALSSIIEAVALDKTRHPSQAHHTLSAEDFMTVFPPAEAPAVVRSRAQGQGLAPMLQWHYAFFLPDYRPGVLSPPPDCA